MRRLAFLTLLTVLAAACSGTPPESASPTPTASVDIKRTKLDISYASLSDQDVHKVASNKILEGAIAAINAEIKKTGGKGEIQPIKFQEVSDTVVPDFKKFAEAAATVKQINPQITADRFADVAIEGMMSASPDCHTYYVDKNGTAHRSRPEPTSGTTAQIPTTGTSLGGPDEAGLVGRMLPGGVVYITWHEFVVTGTYKIFDEVRKMMDKGVAAGAKGWLFDLRGNVGGFDADTIAAFFLNGEKMLNIVYRSGGSTVSTSARKEWRLPDSHQLPLVIILNDRGGSGPEVLAADLRENKRATIVGAKSIGCMGATSITNMSDGSKLAVVTQEFVGANTGFKYNNVGVPPDVQADDKTAVDKAIEILTQKK
ncbi:MAG TPA: S41 family peptidase [Candidatus Limnocylindria bacterium]|jgi:C-terminal processing protease CtpA/Prc|nr:S41 family peptidase [Candidatus Limnocylindria bacterium]